MPAGVVGFIVPIPLRIAAWEYPVTPWCYEYKLRGPCELVPSRALHYQNERN
jgi:hypothetical protein